MEQQFAKETLPVSLEEEMRKSYLDYAMSVIVGRALPDGDSAPAGWGFPVIRRGRRAGVATALRWLVVYEQRPFSTYG